MPQIWSLHLQHDQDVVTARQRAAHVAGLLGFDVSEQTRIATAVSEIVRNAFRYTGGGAVEFDFDGDSRPQRLVVRVTDQGRGIPHLDDVMSGRYKSATGMGIGIMGARRLMDRFTIDSTASGTAVLLEKYLPQRLPLISGARSREIAREVEKRPPQGLVEEIQLQNRELLRALDELQRKQQELVHLNRELEDTNRGVVALYAELDEKADHLRRADELKSRFLSNMTHEFRTPVNSILGLCNLLLDDRQREERVAEPEIMYIRKAADHLSELVNDLLDLAKVEAGKTVVRPAMFEVANLFGALRGMLRPLLLNQAVALVFEDPERPLVLHTDEGKVSQILRNLISNALKFTERGEVRVSASFEDGGHTIAFTVADTGIGIAAEDQQRIFEEFTQLEHRLQRGIRGTGLGLPLSKRLAELLGGTLSVTSEAGLGSTFVVQLPAHYVIKAGPDDPFVEWTAEPGKLPLLVVEDAYDAQYFYAKVLKGSDFQVYPVQTSAEALAAIERVRPAAMIVDIILDGEEAWDLLAELKRREDTRAIPLVVISSLPDREKALALGADAYLLKPIERRALLHTLAGLYAQTQRPVRALVIDDQEVARFLVRQCLPIPAFEVLEADSGEEGLRRAQQDVPDVILLDLVMPDISGRDVLRRIRENSATRGIPVIVVTSTSLEPDERRLLLQQAASVLSKADLSRETLRDAVRRAREHADIIPSSERSGR
jgi:signal transduction histidine kinase/CheY-like chemotaxis protein